MKRYGKHYKNDVYFHEWEDRFRSGSPERYGDSATQKAIASMRKKGYVW